ncbi:MAG: hypothetical protein K0R48_231 [Gammaproteobacteria bacterium]|jgi:hypothetical protein|nr:hypothetical protein [Gammaproteobacteria bacterium]
MGGLKEYSWAELRDKIKLVQPYFCEIIDELSPPRDHTLYLGQYPYGVLILNAGIFQVFNSKNVLVPLNDITIDSKVKTDLGYTGTIPMAIVLQNSIETFFTTDNRTIPSSFYTSGGMVSLWRVLEGDCSYQEGALWSISSGARTICMLPKITENTGHELLRRKYNLRLPAPTSLNDHWAIFTRIANHKDFTQKWHSELAFFSKEWFQHKGDRDWSRFNELILNQAWADSTFKRNQFIFDFAFSLAQKSGNLKPNPYLADTVKHLFGIGAGGMPGFTPAIDNIAAPIDGLQKVYLDDYKLRKYAPIIMHLHHFSSAEDRPVYYSLTMPTTTVFSPRSSRALSKMVDIRELKHILDTVISEIVHGTLMVEKTPLFALAKDLSYQFYHSEKDPHNEILSITHLAEYDPVLQKILASFEDRVFPEFSSFINGCIAIAKKSKD